MTELLELRSSISLQLIDDLLNVFKEINQSNIWSKVTSKDDFTIKRFDLGNDSNLCCCILTENAKSKYHFNSAKDCEGIVVKFLTFGENGITDNGLSLTDIAVVNTILSINKISPKFLFANSKCYVHEYIESRVYTFEDDDDPKTVKQLARILAKFHSLDAPVSNNAYKTSQKSYESFLYKRKHIYGWGDTEATGQKYLKVMEQHPEIKEKYYDEFAKIDYHLEIVNVHNLKEHLKSPIVFAHSDFNRGNRLIRKRSDGQQQIYLIDFDATSMNNRGADFGDYFANYRHKEDFADEGFPSDEEMSLFLNEYRTECGRILGAEFLSKEENTLEHMIDESKMYTLDSYIGGTFFGLMWYQQVHNTEKGQYFLNVVKNQSRGYNRLKKRFTEDGTIPRILQQKKQTKTFVI